MQPPQEKEAVMSALNSPLKKTFNIEREIENFFPGDMDILPATVLDACIAAIVAKIQQASPPGPNFVAKASVGRRDAKDGSVYIGAAGLAYMHIRLAFLHRKAPDVAFRDICTAHAYVQSALDTFARPVAKSFSFFLSLPYLAS